MRLEWRSPAVISAAIGLIVLIATRPTRLEDVVFVIVLSVALGFGIRAVASSPKGPHMALAALALVVLLAGCAGASGSGNGGSTSSLSQPPQGGQGQGQTPSQPSDPPASAPEGRLSAAEYVSIKREYTLLSPLRSPKDIKTAINRARPACQAVERPNTLLIHLVAEDCHQ